MIEEYNLSVFVAFNFGTGTDAILVRIIKVGVDVDNFSVTTVTEEETRVGVRIDLEVRGVVVLDLLALPRVVAQIAGLRHNLLSL